MSANELPLRTPGRLGRPPRGTEAEATGRILAAAQPIFFREGFEVANVDAIANAAGVSKKTIYARFASKEDLFEAVMVRFIKDNVPLIERAAVEEGPVAQRLERIALATLEVALSPNAVAARRIIVAESVRFPAFARLFGELGIARIVHLIERCLEDGTRTGEIAVADVQFTTDLFVSIAIRGFTDKVQFGFDRSGLTHVKRETLKRSIDFFMSACRVNPAVSDDRAS